jgi:hypothetical protein
VEEIIKRHVSECKQGRVEETGEQFAEISKCINEWSGEIKTNEALRKRDYEHIIETVGELKTDFRDTLGEMKKDIREIFRLLRNGTAK